jgi:hypothetical protein
MNQWNLVEIDKNPIFSTSFEVRHHTKCLSIWNNYFTFREEGGNGFLLLLLAVFGISDSKFIYPGSTDGISAPKSISFTLVEWMGFLTQSSFILVVWMGFLIQSSFTLVVWMGFLTQSSFTLNHFPPPP